MISKVAPRKGITLFRVIMRIANGVLFPSARLSQRWTFLTRAVTEYFSPAYFTRRPQSFQQMNPKVWHGLYFLVGVHCEFLWGCHFFFFTQYQFEFVHSHTDLWTAHTRRTMRLIGFLKILLFARKRRSLVLNIWKTFNVTQRGFGIVISHSEVESPWLMSESDDYACVAKTFCIQHVQLYTQKDLLWNRGKKKNERWSILLVGMATASPACCYLPCSI